jgi:hypothetical protein
MQQSLPVKPAAKAQLSHQDLMARNGLKMIDRILYIMKHISRPLPSQITTVPILPNRTFVCKESRRFLMKIW